MILSISIHQPRPNQQGNAVQPLPAFHDLDNQTYNLVVFGDAPDDQLRLAGILSNEARGDQYPGGVLSGAPNWAMFFRIPDKAGYTYSLDIWDNNHPSVKGSVRHIQLAVVEPSYGFSIVFPDNNVTVCPDFCANGHADNTSTPTGTMKASDGTKYYGTALQSGPDWVLQFTGLDSSKTYNFNVSVVPEGGGTLSHHVDPTLCE